MMLEGMKVFNKIRELGQMFDGDVGDILGGGEGVEVEFEDKFSAEEFVDAIESTKSLKGVKPFKPNKIGRVSTVYVAVQEEKTEARGTGAPHNQVVAAYRKIMNLVAVEVEWRVISEMQGEQLRKAVKKILGVK